MAERKKARLFQNGGSQAVRLPAEFRFEGDSVYISRDETTGDVILSKDPKRATWSGFIEWRDTLDPGSEDFDEYLKDRPMNRPVRPRSVFEGEG